MRTLEGRLSGELLGGEVLVALAKARAHGVLSVTVPAGAERLTFRDGRPVALHGADNQSTSARDAVVRSVRQLAIAAAGEYHFEPQQQAEGSASHIDTLGETLVALLRATPEPVVEAVTVARGANPVEATSAFERLIGVAQRSGGVTLAQPSGNGTWNEWLNGQPLAARRTALVLMVLGGVRMPGPPLVVPVADPPRPTAPPGGPAPASAQAPPKTERARKKRTSPLPADLDGKVFVKEIDGLYAALPDKSYYELLGVAENAAADAVRNAYFELARKWHRDVLAQKGLADDVLDMAEEIFSLMGEAHRVLMDAEERKNYDFILARRRKGLPTDPQVIMRAEAAFQRGKVLVRRGQMAQAEPLLREAVEINPGEAEFWVYHGYALYSANGSKVAQEAREKIKKGLEMQAKMSEAHEFLGRIARAEGETQEAMRCFKKAVEQDPRNSRAELELRLLQRRIDKGADESKGLGGLFNKLLKR